MNATLIKAIQTKIGTPADGFWGPASVARCQAYLSYKMPRPNPWPKSDQKSLTAFFGAPGDESQLVSLAVLDLGIKYEGGEVKTIRCHSKVANSLWRVLTGIRAWQDATPGAPDVLGNYDGCYNNRAMRGGSLPSLHARGAAVDFWSAKNGNKTHWPTAAMMPLEVMEIFAREGWLAAGAFWSRDAMHFQATQ